MHYIISCFLKLKKCPVLLRVRVLRHITNYTHPADWTARTRLPETCIYAYMATSIKYQCYSNNSNQNITS